MTEPTLRVAVLADTVTGGGGMARYTREIVRALARRHDVELVVVAPSDAGLVLDGLGLGDRVVATVPIRGGTRVGRGLWERYSLGHRLERDDVDVVHGTKHLLPRTRLPTVLTVHDLFPLTWPQQFGPVKRALLPRQYLASLREADALVTVSEAVRDRLAALEPELAAKAVAAPNGLTRHLFHVDAVPVPGLVDRPFALIVGDLSPRKNAQFLFDLWPEIHRATGLVLAAVGPDGWRSRTSRRRLAALVAEGLAARPGLVSDGELRWCYEHARVVLLPTVEEGFGLPVLEAAAFNVPVVANPDPALVEAGRGWPTFVELADRAGWVRAVAAAAAMRPEPNDLARSAPTWDDHASALVDAYRRVSTDRSPVAA